MYKTNGFVVRNVPPVYKIIWHSKKTMAISTRVVTTQDIFSDVLSMPMILISCIQNKGNVIQVRLDSSFGIPTVLLPLSRIQMRWRTAADTWMINAKKNAN